MTYETVQYMGSCSKLLSIGGKPKETQKYVAKTLYFVWYVCLFYTYIKLAEFILPKNSVNLIK